MKNILQNLKLFPIYGTYAIMFGQASFSKIANLGGVPSWFQKQFEATILNPFPGSMTLEFYGIACLELIVTILIVASFARGEFFNGRRKPLLQWGLFLSGLAFCILSLGLRITGDFATAAQVFTYMIASFALIEFFKRTEGPQTP